MSEGEAVLYYRDRIVKACFQAWKKYYYCLSLLTVRNVKILRTSREIAIQKWMAAISFWETRIMQRCVNMWLDFVSKKYQKMVINENFHS